MVLLPETSAEFAIQVTERVRSSIEQVRIDLPQAESLPITASFGLTQYQLGESFSETINRADALLLEAKTLGRTRVFVA